MYLYLYFYISQQYACLLAIVRAKKNNYVDAYYDHEYCHYFVDYVDHVIL